MAAKKGVWGTGVLVLAVGIGGLLILWKSGSQVEVQKLAIPEELTWSPAPASGMLPERERRLPILAVPDPEFKGTGPRVVVWISIPGFRGDYVEKSDSAFFQQLIDEGLSSGSLRPSFPCLTFPAHAALATGATAEVHGIPADRIRTESGEIFDQPLDGKLLRAEPIWATATGQRIRTLVYDWPLSQNQTGPDAAAFFLKDYDPLLTDRQRLDAVWKTWAEDSTESRRLRLVMFRLNDIFEAAMKFGPLEKLTLEAVAECGRNLRDFFTRIGRYWAQLAPEKSGLAIVVTTDHGFSQRDKSINLPELLGPEILRDFDVIAHDGIANLFFRNRNGSKVEDAFQRLDREVSRRTYFRGYFPPGAFHASGTVSPLPDSWEYNIEGRAGDRVISLRRGYSFSDAPASDPVFDPREAGGKFASFGHPVESSPRMSGQAIIWEYPGSMIPGRIDDVEMARFHATVCKLLGIKPAQTALKETLPIN